MTDTLKKKFLAHLTEVANSMEYTDIDVFCEENGVDSDWEIGELLDLSVKVVEA